MSPSLGDPRHDSLRIAESAIDGVHAGVLLRPGLADLEAEHPAGRVLVIAVGKAAPAMVEAVTATVPEVHSGVVVSAEPVGSRERRPALRYLVGDHPVPGEASERAGRAVLEYVARLRPRREDLVLLLVSGGGSALVTAPRRPLDSADLRATYRSLLLSGIDVTTMNQVRAGVSRIHGGALLRALAPARVRSFVLSDNVQVGPSAVASGLASESFADAGRAREVVEAADLDDALRVRLREALSEAPGSAGAEGDHRTLVIGTPDLLVEHARTAARERGYDVIDLGARVQSEARTWAATLGSRLVGLDRRRPICLVAGGEVVVTVRGEGRGGRCQELAYAVGPHLPERSGFTAMASDGRDFLAGTMGAGMDPRSHRVLAEDPERWRAHLERNDTHGPLARAGLCLPSRETATNLCDVYVTCLSPLG